MEVLINLIVLQNLELGLLTRIHSKVNLLTPGFGEGKYSIYYRVSNKENRQLMIKRPKLPEDFQGRGFKGSVRVRTTEYLISLCSILR